MTDQDELHGAIRAFTELEDSESVPLLMSLSTWRGDIDKRTADQSAQAIALAVRYEALVAAQDAFFVEKVQHDQENAALARERADYASAFTALQGTLLGAAMRWRDRAAYFETTLAVIEEAE